MSNKIVDKDIYKDIDKDIDRDADKEPVQTKLSTAKVERAKFNTNFQESGKIKYQAGEHYPLTDETESQIVAGNAEKVTVEMNANEHRAQHDAAHAALHVARKATHDAEADARKRGQLK